jgi:Concanavalin A-like lectin/glucanases superfamily
MYVNGAREGTPIAQTGSLQTNPSFHAAIGANPDPIENFWSGKIDDVRIYNRALSPAEIAQLFQLGTVILRQ